MQNNPGAQLCPAQQSALESLLKGLIIGSIFRLNGATGRGKTTVLKEIHKQVGGAFLGMKDFAEASAQANPLALEETLYSLVFNALKYGRPNTAVRVSLDGTRADEVVLAVQNIGKPIRPALLPTLFDPLVRGTDEDSDADSQIAGANLGLGLYVVREIATAHGGTVEVTSDDPVTRFELRLPRFCVRKSNHAQ